MKGWMVAALLFLAAPVFAQEAVVAQAKADLVAAGVDLSGACGAWRITNLAAWRLKDTGAGLYFKGYGAGCDGRNEGNPNVFSSDILAYADGRCYDVLGDAGGANNPAFNLSSCASVPDKWRAPLDPSYYYGGSPAPQPGPTPQPTPAFDPTPLLERLDGLAAEIGAIESTLNAMQSALPALDARLKVLESKPIPVSCSAAVFGVPIHCALK